VREKGNLVKLQFHHTLYLRTNLPPSQTRRISRVRNQVSNCVRKAKSLRTNHNQHPRQNQSTYIVSIVGGIFTRESFALGESVRRGLLGRWQTRTCTAPLVVCLSFAFCLGVRVLCIQSRLGEIKAFLPEVLRVQVSVQNVVPTLTSNKRRGLSLDGRC
jgi:hypothetical protein